MVFINFALEINWRLTSGMKVKFIICFWLNFDVQQFFLACAYKISKLLKAF